MIQKAALARWSEGDREYAEAVQEELSAKSRELGRAMSYRDFTYEEVKERFGLRVVERPGVFASVPSRPVGDAFREVLAENLPIAVPTASESARRELIVSPVLVEVRRQLNRQISVFSGVNFTVDEQQGLAGYSDFLLSRSPEQLFPEAPVVVIVESKKDSIGAGIPQCLAEMVAAQLFNQRSGAETKAIHGGVTTGSVWQFMSLTGADVTIDLTEYYINEVERIVGILVSMLKGEGEGEGG